jgi:hypothetical protein
MEGDMSLPTPIRDTTTPRIVVRTPPLVDDNKVEMALRQIRADIPLNQSQLANALRNPNLNQAEKDLILQKLAREGDHLSFFANDASRLRDGDYASLSEDQRVIAEAVQKAYDDGAIDADDLVRIADQNGAPNGAQRFMDILEMSGVGRAPGGVAEVLADKLWARNGNDGKDRAVAAMEYSSDPAMMSRNLDTPDKRAAAIEALVKFNEGKPYESLPGSTTRTVWEYEALGAEGRIFTTYSQELIDRYTSVTPEHGAETETLAKLMSQTVYNPEAKNVWMDRRQDLVPAVRNALGNAADTYLQRARDAKPGSAEQRHAMEQFGRLTASVSGGAAVALTEYSDQIEKNEASKKEFADLVGGLVGKVVKIDTPLGNPAEKVASAIAEKVYEAINKNPDRPDQALAGALYDNYTSRIEALSRDLGGVDLSTAYDSAYSAELLNLQQNLNVNLGGQEK